jgi:hypothetical protein
MSNEQFIIIIHVTVDSRMNNAFYVRNLVDYPSTLHKDINEI